MRKLATFLALVLVSSAGFLTVPAQPAQAADIKYSYAARTGGTHVKIFDGTVNSEVTAQSSVTGGADSATSTNSTESAKVADLLRIGGIETETTAKVAATSTTLTSFARTAGVNLLKGLIKVDAVETNVSTTGRADGSDSFTADTKLLGISIVGVNLPVRIPKNYSVKIPGVAAISLNVQLHNKVDGIVSTVGWAIGVTLIKPRDGYSAGTRILVNPVNQYLGEVKPTTGAKLYGTAYGTRAQVDAGSSVQVLSEPTAYIATPPDSSKGQTLRNQTLGVNVPGLLTTGAVTSTTYSTKDLFGNAVVRNTNEIARLNILSGLIRADAIEVSAAGTMQDGKWTSRMRTTFVNLVVAGRKIPIDVGKNTVINVARLGEVAINLQQKNASNAANRIYGIRITLGTKRAGLPVGAVIEIGVATTIIR